MSDQILRPHFDGLETAFLQLSFALKLWHYIADGALPRETFDIALTIHDNDSVYVMRQGEFISDDDLAIAAGNNIAICFGAAAITLWEAIRERTGMTSAALEPKASEHQMIAALSFALRCCFAHGTAVPRWQLHAKYRIEYRIGPRRIDLRHVDGAIFNYSQIGGIDGLRLLRYEAVRLGLV